MAKGRRYEEGRKLNMKKVYGVIGTLIVIIAIVVTTNIALNADNRSSIITSETYFSSYNQEKWGVINSKGEAVIEASYVEMIIVPNEKEDVFLCTYDVDYVESTYSTKVLDSKNEEIYTGYEKVEAIQNKDNSNNMWYEKEVLRVEKNGKVGLISLADGKSILECEYEDITALVGTENAFVITKSGKLGVADNKGNIIVEPNYMSIENIGIDNKDGYIVESADGKYGVVDYSNNIILETIYEGIASVYSKNYYVVIEDGKERVINKQGETILSEGFDQVKSILKSENGIIAIKEGVFGVISFEGEEIIPMNYQYIEETSSEVFVANKDGNFGIIDSDETLMLGYDYTSIRYSELADLYIAEDSLFNSKIYNSEFEQKQEGIFLKIDESAGYIELKQDGEIKYYNFSFEEKKSKDFNTTASLFITKENGKYGFVNEKGEIIVECQYDDAKEQNSCGYLAIKLNGKWGALDKNGNVVVEPIYNLDDYLIIDFVGKWHLGKDLNINYYNQLDK